MLQVTLIGNLGADARLQSANGRDFTAFRVANTERWKDDAGQVHESTTWVDCIMDGQPKVFEYLKRGQLVYVVGSCKLRVYSSEKDRCMKAGMTISVARIELLGGKSDDVPAKLIEPVSGNVYEVQKWFLVPNLISQTGEEREIHVQAENGREYVVNKDGWVLPEKKN